MQRIKREITTDRIPHAEKKSRSLAGKKIKTLLPGFGAISQLVFLAGFQRRRQGFTLCDRPLDSGAASARPTNLVLSRCGCFFTRFERFHRPNFPQSLVGSIFYCQNLVCTPGSCA